MITKELIELLIELKELKPKSATDVITHGIMHPIISIDNIHNIQRILKNLIRH